MSLRKDVERRVTEYQETDQQQREEYQQIAVDLQERHRLAGERISSLKTLLQPLIEEAAAEGVIITDSTDPEIKEYFASTVGKLRLGFVKTPGSAFEPLSYNFKSGGHVQICHQVEGLWIILKSEAEEESAETYYQGISLLPGMNGENQESWGITSTSYLVRSEIVDMRGLYALLYPTGMLPSLDIHDSDEELLAAFRDYVVEFLAQVERKKQARVTRVEE